MSGEDFVRFPHRLWYVPCVVVEECEQLEHVNEK